MNTPKLLLQAVVPPLYAWAFYSAAQLGPEGIIRAGVAVGLFHSLQYHRLLWFHNKNRHRGPDGLRGVRGPVHAAAAARRADGLERGHVCRLPRGRPRPRGASATAADGDGGGTMTDLLETKSEVVA